MISNTSSSGITLAPWDLVARYAYTVWHLHPTQIFSRLRPKRAGTIRSVTAEFRRPEGPWCTPIARETAQLGVRRFRLLNQEYDLRTWDDADLPLLWRYNLHYFAHCDLPLIAQWITDNPVGKGIGWDPYPTSLRIANWCKWGISEQSLPQYVCDSIAMQASWLETRVETHLLANHLLANAKALILAGLVLDCAESKRWRERGLRLLHQELPRQILDDGGHVERSPMYHSIILEDLLDIFNAVRAYRMAVPRLSGYIPRMLRWLRNMSHPDGEIAFFNDSSFGIAPDPATLHNYAVRLGFAPCHLALGESGYVRLENSSIVLLFDAAPLGPEYQPGHGHADTLSFELSYRGQRVFVNSGTSTYDQNAVREYERGTAAHNTVCLDHLDQSEMWAAFRVARRARPFGLRTDRCSFAEASHTGYRRLRHSVTHHRRIELQDDAVVITDRLEGRGRHSAEIYFHLAPGVSEDVQLDPKLCRSVECGTYATGWNLRVPNRVLVGKWQGGCPVQFVTRIALGRNNSMVQ